MVGVKFGMEISRGMYLFHFQDFFFEDGSKAIKPKGLELVKLANGMYIFHLEVPFGNFGLPVKKSCFPRKFQFRETKLIPSKISGFSG